MKLLRCVRKPRVKVIVIVDSKIDILINKLRSENIVYKLVKAAPEDLKLSPSGWWMPHK